MFRPQPDFDKRNCPGESNGMGSYAFSGSRRWRRASYAPGRELGGRCADPPLRSPAGAGGRLAILFATTMLTLARPGTGQAADALCPDEGSRRGRVAAVNERLELTLEGGIQLKIAGVDPPRPTPEDPDIDVRTRDRLAQWLLGKDIFFRPVDTNLDRWGRLPAFVFAPGAELANMPENRPMPVAAALIDAGLARYEPSAAARPCRTALLAAEDGARAAGLGLWADPYYAVIAAADRLSFKEKAGTVVIVEGRVTGIADRRPRIMLYFGPRQGWDFSVTIYSRNNKAFDAAYAELAGLTSRTVRVRGLLDTRFGPQIEISNPDEIEIIGQEPGAQAAHPGTPAPK